MLHIKVYAMLLAATVMVAAGCTSIGPDTVTRDRFDYNRAIARSWKEQTLLNIVRLRYADMPVFVEVASVLSGYTLEGSVDLGSRAFSSGALANDFFTLGTGGRYTDRPTITYTPITGSHFNKSFMTPIPPEVLLFLMESGWSADIVFPVVVEAVNGLRSNMSIGSRSAAGDPGYYRTIELISQVQASGYAHLRVIKDVDKEGINVIMLYRKGIPDELKRVLHELDTLLGLRSDTNEIKVTYGVIPEKEGELALLTRSMLQVMVALAGEIDVRQEDVDAGIIRPTRPVRKGEDGESTKLITVHTGLEEPDDPFITVNYDDSWYWIAKNDFHSKRVFTFLMILFSLTESGGKEGLPLVTIPAG